MTAFMIYSLGCVSSFGILVGFLRLVDPEHPFKFREHTSMMGWWLVAWWIMFPSLILTGIVLVYQTRGFSKMLDIGFDIKPTPTKITQRRK